MHLTMFAITNFKTDDIVTKLGESASNISCFVIKVELSGDMNWFKLIGRLSLSYIDLNVKLVILVVGE